VNDTDAERKLLVLLRGASDRRLAIPLDRVSRLEDVPAAKLERSGRHTVVQYRGELMPILDLDALLGEPAGAVTETEKLPVVVVELCGRRFGLAVAEITDIVEADVAGVSDVGAMPGLAGALVIDDRVTDLVDVDRLLGGTGDSERHDLAEAEADLEMALAAEEG
jgi:two-component system chemotaxis sensor kinase CheA